MRNRATILRWAAWGATRAFGIAAVYGAVGYGWKGFYPVAPDLHSYWGWAFLFQHGLLPYRAVGMVYPPGILPFLVMPAVSMAAYQAAFLALALLADAYAVRRLGELKSGRGAWLWLAAGPLLGPVFWARFDVFVAVAVVVAVCEYNRGRDVRAAAWFGAAAAIKIWPLLLLVPLLMRSRGRRRIAAAGLAPLSALSLPVLAWGGGRGLLASVHAQVGRGIEIESVLAFPLQVAHAAGLYSGRPELSLSWQYRGAFPALLADGATVVAGVMVVAWLLAAVTRRVPLPQLLFALVAVLFATGKVLSAQYGLWMLAAVVVVVGEDPAWRRLWIATAVYLVATQALYPLGYAWLLRAGPTGAVLSGLHALMVATLATMSVTRLMASLRRTDPAARAAAEPSPHFVLQGAIT